jgi:hypothetical protein
MTIIHHIVSSCAATEVVQALGWQCDLPWLAFGTIV